MLKSGFASNGLAREMEIRCGSTLDFLPGLRDASVGSTWFEEPFLDGVALNRVRGIGRRRAVLKEAVRKLERWLERSVVTADVNAYAASLNSNINALLEKIALLPSEHKRLLRSWTDRMTHLVDGLPCRAELPLAMSHGDFQEGNILVGDEQFWIVDWEHAGVRQSAYDLLVLTLQTRSRDGLARRLAALVGGSAVHDVVQVPWAALGYEADLVSLRRTLGLFLMEELVWALEENSNPHFRSSSRSLRRFQSEMWPCLNVLIGN